MVGSSFLPSVSEEHRPAILEKIERLRAGESPLTEEHRVNLPDGRIGWQRWTDRGLYDGEGRLGEL